VVCQLPRCPCHPRCLRTASVAFCTKARLYKPRQRRLPTCRPCCQFRKVRILTACAAHLQQALHCCLQGKSWMTWRGLRKIQSSRSHQSKWKTCQVIYHPLALWATTAEIAAAVISSTRVVVQMAGHVLSAISHMRRGRLHARKVSKLMLQRSQLASKLHVVHPDWSGLINCHWDLALCHFPWHLAQSRFQWEPRLRTTYLLASCAMNLHRRRDPRS
jgi:hypothetical protein